MLGTSPLLFSSQNLLPQPPSSCAIMLSLAFFLRIQKYLPSSPGIKPKAHALLTNTLSKPVKRKNASDNVLLLLFVYFFFKSVCQYVCVVWCFTARRMEIET